MGGVVAGVVTVLTACVAQRRLGAGASKLALVTLLAMLPSLWAGAAAVLASRASEAAAPVRPDEWVRDDDPATLDRLPAVGRAAPREQQVVTTYEGDPSHHGLAGRSAGTFRSGPATFAFSNSRDVNSRESSVSSHGWTCRSSSNPDGTREYELHMRSAPDGTAIAFDCHLVNCAGAYSANRIPTCRPEIAPLVFRHVHFVAVPHRGSLRAALVGLTASLVACWLASRWLRRPWRAAAPAASPRITLGAGPFRGSAAGADPDATDARDFERSMRARRLAVALACATALLGSAAALPTVMTRPATIGSDAGRPATAVDPLRR